MPTPPIPPDGADSMPMPASAWYDRKFDTMWGPISRKDGGTPFFFGPWIKSATPSIDAVNALLEQQYEENEHLSPSVTVVAGYLQGGAIALWTAMLRKGEPLAGVMCLSSVLPVPNHHNKSKPTITGKRTPVLLIHGAADLVNRRFAETTQSRLLGRQVSVALMEYSKTERTLNSEQKNDMVSWLKKVLAPSLLIL